MTETPHAHDATPCALGRVPAIVGTASGLSASPHRVDIPAESLLDSNAGRITDFYLCRASVIVMIGAVPVALLNGDDLATVIANPDVLTKTSQPRNAAPRTYGATVRYSF